MKLKNDKNMRNARIKLIGSGHYHIYSMLVLGNFLLGEKKKWELWRGDMGVRQKCLQNGGMRWHEGSVSKGGEAIAGRGIDGNKCVWN